MRSRTSTGSRSTAQQIIIRGIPLQVLPQYPLSTTIRSPGFLKAMVELTSGLTCGIMLKVQTITSLPTTAGRVVPSVSRAAVI